MAEQQFMEGMIDRYSLNVVVDENGKQKLREFKDGEKVAVVPLEHYREMVQLLKYYECELQRRRGIYGHKEEEPALVGT